MKPKQFYLLTLFLAVFVIFWAALNSEVGVATVSLSGQVGSQEVVQGSSDPARSTDPGRSQDPDNAGEVIIKNPLKFGTIPDILNSVAGFLYALALAVVTVMVLWGGLQILTAAGNPSQIDKGKQTLLWAVIGTVVILIAGGIADLTADILGGGSSSLRTGSPENGTAHCEWRAGEGCKAIKNCKSGFTVPETLNCSKGGTPSECGEISAKNCVK